MKLLPGTQKCITSFIENTVIVTCQYSYSLLLSYSLTLTLCQMAVSEEKIPENPIKPHDILKYSNKIPNPVRPQKE